MRFVFGLVLVLGVGLAGFAVFMAQDRIGQYQAALENQRKEMKNTVPVEQIYVATRKLVHGEILTEKDVKLTLFPKTSIPEGAFRAKDELFPANNERPRYVIRTMEPAEALMAVKVTEPGQDAGVSSRLRKGMRAFAIQVDVTTGVSGFLRPGDHVDIYWSGIAGDAGNVTRLIEANVELIAIDQTADTDRSNPTIARTVTVEVTPQQVASLAQARSSGRLSLSLVGVQDETVAEVSEVDQKSLLGIEEEKIVKIEKPRVCTIRTRRGAEVVEIPIPCAD
ncbi:Flp pilus assembly protein CpaB [Brevirhabdus pacifica]|uniref:Flp pilus assembly protein CpaB n=1 Tax=Brevirhabdus pacifica TaxID=1267768 RepID=A0A1U7DHD3_9RHOB|nr:Flp pilus assembly protein CpaB [Brevirhabdus pacifica]APX89371.1 Flp pilus assembly protein CpaB [Brevirhabdus pacifica]OWU76604.1 pilus assembly protein CpaB [Loktanella sp. 22II-4b]PJJ85995.1 pilus assembly protein CpaB [Brevirhabdus pacifica]